MEVMGPRAARRPARAALVAASLLVVAAGALAGWRAARGAGPDPLPFTGTWTCATGSKLTTMCQGVPLNEVLDGTPLAIRAAAGSDLTLDIGCACALPLTVSASDPNLATLTAPTTCQFVFGEFDITVAVESLTLRLTAGTLELELQAGATRAAPIGDCESSSITASLLKTSDAVRGCGPDATAVGVVPYAPRDSIPCPFGAAREGVIVFNHDEDDTVCLQQTGALGEGLWVLPQSSKYDDLQCRPRDPAASRTITYMSFCRVDGRPFKPLTTDPSATEQFYAVLKLGDEPCPNGAVEMIRRMDTEDWENGSAAVGRLGPNQIVNQIDSTATVFHFCYFRWAETAADTMTTFPDLGFPYAVFHDFEGPQPLWVTLKRWLYSSNESSGNKSDLSSPVGDSQAVGQFERIVERPDNATFFDMARVR
jgi:hypothetical protein